VPATNPSTTVVRIRRHREALRRAGLRPVQLWVPDTRRAGFAEECRAQCLLVAATDEADLPLHALMQEAAQDLEGWAA
jgi:hypothetical protein